MESVNDMQTEKKQGCKFSLENWKIIKDLKEEKRKLEQFEASAVAEFSEDRDCNETSKVFSPSRYYSIASSDSPCNTDIEVNNLLPVERYCRRSICNKSDKELINDECGVKISAVEKYEENISMNPFKRNMSSSYPIHSLEQNNIPSPLASVLYCLINIPKFYNFVQNLALKFVGDTEKYPTIRFFIQALGIHTDQRKSLSDTFCSMFLSQDLSSSLHEELPSSLLFSMLEIFHEELVQAKNKKMVEKLCMEKCKFISKENHTIVSHLFRGHLRRKVTCKCGFVKTEKESFTEVHIPLDDMQEKCFIISYAGLNEHYNFCVTRFMFTVSDWTTVGDVKEKLACVLQKKQLDAPMTVLAMYSVSSNSVLQPLNNQTKIFSLMCRDEDVWTYYTAAGDLSLNLSTLSAQTVLSAKPKKNVIGTSTPAVSDVSGCGRDAEEMLKIKEIPTQRKGYTALVYVQLKFLSCFSGLSIVLRFPRICHGLHVFERLSRIFGLHHADYANISMIIKNKAGHCLFCLNPCCSGCLVQLNDKIMMSQHYLIVVSFHDHKYKKILTTNDDVSVTSNVPHSNITLNECLRGFYEQRNNSMCPSCFNASWLPADSVITKYPDTFIISFPIEEGREMCLQYPVDMMNPYLDNRVYSGKYYLQSVITNDGESSTFVRENGKDTWLVKNGSTAQIMSSPPHTQIELLIYTRDSTRANMSSKVISGVKKKQKLKMMAKTKFSARTGQVRSQFGNKSLRHGDLSTSFTGRYTPRSSASMDQHSMCNCTRCQTFEKMQSQMVQYRAGSEPNVSRVTDIDGSAVPCSYPIRVTDRSSFTSETQFVLEQKLHHAIRKQDLKSVVKHLNEGADVNFLMNSVSALHLAAGMTPPFGNVFTQLCLDHGADPNLASVDGRTPVHMAVASGKEDTLQILLQAGGLPSIKDAQGHNAFDLLLQSAGGKSESILRLLRGEDKPEGTNHSSYASNNHAEEINSIVDDISLLHVSGDTYFPSGKQIGETTFDEIFKHHVQLPTLDEETSNNNNDSDLRESVVAQHFTEIDNSNLSFAGSRQNTWLSFFTCSGRFSKVRRRHNEERWITRVLRQRIIKWFENLFRRN